MYRKISEKLVNSYPCDWESNIRMKETCICGVEIVCSTIVNLLLITILACISSKELEVFLFFMVYGSMRLYSGGIHAKNHFRCILYYSTMLFASVYAAEYLAEFKGGIYILGVLVPVIALGSNYVYGGKQKKLEETESRKYAKTCRVITAILSVHLVIVCMVQCIWWDSIALEFRSYFYIQAFAMLFQSISLFLDRKQCKGGALLF